MQRVLVWTAFALSLAAELLIRGGPGELPWWHQLLGFHALYGLAGCALIVVVSKVLGKSWLQRPEERDD